jgi:hypothetical protein
MATPEIAAIGDVKLEMDTIWRHICAAEKACGHHSSKQGCDGVRTIVINCMPQCGRSQDTEKNLPLVVT